MPEIQQGEESISMGSNLARVSELDQDKEGILREGYPGARCKYTKWLRRETIGRVKFSCIVSLPGCGEEGSRERATEF